MSTKAEEIADNVFEPGLQPEYHAAVISAVNEAMEWCAQQCEAEAKYRDLPHRAHFCADRIRKGKSA